MRSPARPDRYHADKHEPRPEPDRRARLKLFAKALHLVRDAGRPVPDIELRAALWLLTTDPGADLAREPAFVLSREGWSLTGAAGELEEVLAREGLWP